MTLPGRIIEAPSGLKGFDCNQHLSTAQAKAFHSMGYRFCLRYVPRRAPNPGDLTASEAAGILQMGLGLMVVQHVQRPGWLPTGGMGTEYGAFAAKSCQTIGVPMGTTVWCDLEGVGSENPHDGVDPRDVIQFLNNWHNQVGSAGYTPGLYVGYDPDLTADQLGRALRFEHYWAAYNLNRDQVPVPRGVQMRQDLEQVLAGVRFDPDTIKADNKGGLPLMLVDAEWTVQ
jgi:hypothetical protein